MFIFVCKFFLIFFRNIYVYLKLKFAVISEFIKYINRVIVNI
jgi:hypothetical protein